MPHINTSNPLCQSPASLLPASPNVALVHSYIATRPSSPSTPPLPLTSSRPRHSSPTSDGNCSLEDETLTLDLLQRGRVTTSPSLSRCLSVSLSRFRLEAAATGSPGRTNHCGVNLLLCAPHTRA